MVTHDAAGGWSPARTLSSRDAEAFRPEVFVDRTGRATAAWDEMVGRASRVWTASRPAGSGWRDPDPLGEAADSLGVAQLAGLPSGRLVVAHAVGERGGVAVRQWSRSGGWSPPAVVPGGSRSLGWVDVGLAVRGPVVALAAGTHRVDARQRVVVARVSRRGEVARTRLAPPVSVYYGMHLVVNRAGDALVAWDSVRDDDHPVEAAYGAGDGEWGPVTRASATPGDAFLGALAVRRDGDGLVVWNAGELADPDSSRVWARTYSEDR
jgi:hypothetical protein